MKIALVCKKFSPDYGGLERYTLFLSRELVRAGHEVHVFAARWRDESGVFVHPVPMIPLSSPMKNLSFAYFASQAAGTGEFDVVHSMERIFRQDIFRVSDGINPVQLQRRYPHAPIRWVKSKGPRRLVLKLLEQRIFLKGGCKAVMANSDLVKRQIIAHYGIKPEKVVVIYNGVDLSRFYPGVKVEHRDSVRKTHGLSEEDLVLLFISNDFKLKGLRLLLEAMVLTGSEETKLIVIGSDKPDPYKRFAEKNGLEGRVRFLGAIKEVEVFYGASDVLVLPTRYDAFANVCLEAMAAGLPVITSRNNGAAELIQDGISGYVVDGRDPRELALRISDLKSKETRYRMGVAAAGKAGAHTPEKHVSEVLGLYAKIASGGKV